MKLHSAVRQPGPGSRWEGKANRLAADREVDLAGGGDDRAGGEVVQLEGRWQVDEQVLLRAAEPVVGQLPAAVGAPGRGGGNLHDEQRGRIDADLAHPPPVRWQDGDVGD